MRQRIQRMRQLFVNTLQERRKPRLQLYHQTERHVLLQWPDKRTRLRLARRVYAYAVVSGLRNVAGMTPDNMAPLCEAIAEYKAL
ncbi:hypothetical protein OHD50_05480 [Escherichia coli]|nr:hypothetical protein [Escherichia coli]